MQGVDVDGKMDMHKNTEFWGDVVVPGMGRYRRKAAANQNPKKAHAQNESA